MFLGGLLTVLTALICTKDVVGRSNRSLNVAFPDIPSSATNVVHDNFLGISWELFTLQYLCRYHFAITGCTDIG